MAIKNTTYFTIQGWMIQDLGLTSMNEIMTYAIIYGFSQDGHSRFTGTQQYLSECTKVSKRTMSDILKRLSDANLIIKEEVDTNHVIFYNYRVNFDTLAEISGGMKKLQGGDEKIASHNTIYNTNRYNKNIVGGEKSQDKNLFPFIDETRLEELSSFNEKEISRLSKWYKSQYKKSSHSPTDIFDSLISTMLDRKNSGQDIVAAIDESIIADTKKIIEINKKRTKTVEINRVSNDNQSRRF